MNWSSKEVPWKLYPPNKITPELSLTTKMKQNSKTCCITQITRIEKQV